MATIIILFIIIACAVVQYLKNTFVNAIISIFLAIIAGIIAFGYFEFVSGILIRRADQGMSVTIASWAQSISFLFLFALLFGGLQTGFIFLTKENKIEFDFIPETIGRIVCGIILGVFISGYFLTFLGLSPISAKFPYSRFEASAVNLDSPKKALPNTDGLVTGLFGMVSKGSFSGKNSFADLHPNFLDQLYLNRITPDVSRITNEVPAISISSTQAVWPVSEALENQIDEIMSGGTIKDEETGQTVPMPGRPKGSYNPMIVRIGIKRNALSNESNLNGGVFSLSQLRLICTDAEGSSTENVYPFGYLGGADNITISSQITVVRTHYEDSTTKEVDFVFCIPTGLRPAFVQFKQNSVVRISSNAILADASEAPAPAILTPAPAGGRGPGGQGMRGRGGEGMRGPGGEGMRGRGGEGMRGPGGEGMRGPGGEGMRGPGGEGMRGRGGEPSGTLNIPGGPAINPEDLIPQRPEMELE